MARRDSIFSAVHMEPADVHMEPADDRHMEPAEVDCVISIQSIYTISILEY